MTSEELIKLREENDLTKAAFAAVIGITPMLQGRYESGKLAIPEKVEEKIKELFQEKKAKKTRKAAKPEKAPATEEKKPVEKKPSARKAKAKLAAPAVYIQSQMGGSITPEEVLSRIPKEAEAVYIKPEENMAYWVKGDDGGAVELW